MTVYLIRNSVNGKVYIGKTVKTAQQRWKQHCAASKVADSSIHLRAAIRKYGPQVFDISVLAVATSKSELNDLERKYIAMYQSTVSERGYNQTLGGDGASIGNRNRVGCHLSPEHKAAISAANKGPKSAETRARMSAVQSVRTWGHSDVTRNRLAAKPRQGSPEHRAKLRAAHLGKKQSAETIAKRAAAMIGHSVSAESRAKSSAAQIGRSKSIEAKRRMSDAHRGKTISAEHRQRIGDSVRSSWQRKRELKSIVKP